MGCRPPTVHTLCMSLTLGRHRPRSISPQSPPPLTLPRRAASRAQSIRLLLRSDLVALRVTLPHWLRVPCACYSRIHAELSLAPTRRPRSSVQVAPSRSSRAAAGALLMICLLVLVPSLQAPPQRRVFAQAATMLPPEAPASFRAWPALNDEATRKAVNAGRRFRLHLQNASVAEASGGDPTLELFQADTLMNRFALALAR